MTQLEQTAGFDSVEKMTGTEDLGQESSSSNLQATEYVFLNHGHTLTRI